MIFRYLISALMLMFAVPVACSAPEGAATPVPPAQMPDNNNDADNGNDADNNNDADNGNEDDNADNDNADNDNADTDNDNQEEQTNMKINVTVGGRVFAATLEDNDAARRFAALLPLSLDMEELNGNEKYFYLSESLPANATSVESIAAGDLMLWQNSCVVLFYKSFRSGYSYTRLGRLDSPEGIADAVGKGSVTVGFSAAR